MEENKLITKAYEFLEDPRRGRLILIAILILSLIFVPIYYATNSKLKDTGKINTPNKPAVVKTDKPELNKGEEDTPVNTKPPKNFDQEGFESKALGILKEKNINEIKKVQDFVDIKANRKATIQLIEESIKIKESMYVELTDNKAGFSQDKYNDLEDAIIQSLAMSEEFLQAFDSRTTIGDLKTIVKKYTK